MHGRLETTEWHSLDPTNKPLPKMLQTTGTFPEHIRSAMGTTLNGTPRVCGGAGTTHLKKCWRYDNQTNEWTESGQMLEVRQQAGSTCHPAKGWVITGGDDHGLKLSAEWTSDGIHFESFTELPITLKRHCWASLDGGGDSGEFFLAGGYDGQGASNKTYIYKEQSWIRVQDMPTARFGLVCGSVRSSLGGPVEKVVAAGGPPHLSTVEIYDLSAGIWTRGTELPERINGAYAVQYKTTFLIVGGGYGSKNKIYHYHTDGAWRERGELIEKRRQPVAMIVSSALFN